MITRRNFINLSTATAAAISITSCDRQPDLPKKCLPSDSKKKGLGQTVKIPGWTKRLGDLRCKWFYSWDSSIPEGVPQGMEFIPMIYRYRGKPQAISDDAASAKKAGIKELLGFNEPDVAKQGKMTIQETLDAWPLLMDTGM